jgi:pimeloyl-ACP methyl ester carboxylesterase
MLDEFLHKQLRLPYSLRAKTLRKVENPRAVVIFVHGIASSVEMWTQAEQFVKGDYNVFAVDLLGHGQSPKPD